MLHGNRTFSGQYKLLSSVLTNGLVTLSSDNVPVIVFECHESSLTGKAAPVMRSSPEMFDKIVLVVCRECAMFAGKFAGGNVIGSRCISILILLTSCISCKMLEQIIFCRLTRRCIPLIGCLKCASWSTRQAPDVACVCIGLLTAH